ncbi:unnamed protein product [Aspergillus oryzae var. brunneus]|uniref:Unnamed protein product n=1 Tax=Aspergillus oryzae var. brunneus TaxID=332754 RepID=A0ABQ6KYZ3_ASPOZ|nr:unnamed protein product [Aspergillus oryzae var. brunneus]
MMKDTLSFARLALLLFGFVVIPTQAIVGGIATTNSISIGAVYTQGLFGSQYACAGTFVSSNKFLTAADCVLGHSPRDISIKWGASNRLNEPSSSPPTLVTIQPDYNELTGDANVAVLTLKTSTTGPSHATLAKESSIQTGDALTLYGWGLTGLEGLSTRFPAELHMVEVPALSTSECRSEGIDIGAGQFCDQSDSGKGFCIGDHGGPVVDSSGTVVGIISGRENCGLGTPEVITNVAYYYHWIISQ